MVQGKNRMSGDYMKELKMLAAAVMEELVIIDASSERTKSAHLQLQSHHVCICAIVAHDTRFYARIEDTGRTKNEWQK
jgi:hypothetical protein